MPVLRVFRLLCREALVPLFCAIIALSGIAQARASGVKLADPAAMAQLFNCGKTLPDASLPGSDDGTPPDHDCADCCLPTPVAAQVWRIALPFRLVANAALPPATGTVDSGRITTEIPWSRGPPREV